MKKIILSTIGLIAFYANSQNVNFTDQNLKQRIVLHGQNIVGGILGPNISLIDSDLNGEISLTEATNYTGRLYLNQGGSTFYTNLTGVEEFINITELYCENNQMTGLNISANTALTGLHCENNQISSLNLSNNTSLEKLNFRYNNIGTINLTNNVALLSIICTNNTLTSLNLANQSNLTSIDCSNNSISTISFNNTTNLLDLICSNNNINTLSVSNFTNLYYLNCNDNNIIAIDLSTNTNIESVFADNNGLTSLTLPSSSLLETVSAQNNQLTTIDFSGTTDIFSIYLANNFITEIDLSNNANLYEVNVNNNSIDSLDFTYATQYLYDVNCDNNGLVYLDISNGNNTYINTFSTTGNPDLTCIEVDDATYSTANWTNIDNQTNFSIDCPTFVNSITVEGENSVSEITTNGGTLQMEASVLPIIATDNTVTWSVTNGTGGATIDINGLLIATNNGTVTVFATANDGSGVTGNTIITLSGQTMASLNSPDIFELNIYPNPTRGELNIHSSEQIETVKIYNISGQKVFETNQNKLDLSHLNLGIYYVVIISKNHAITKQVMIK